jgi:prolyl-tRNA synthetase
LEAISESIEQMIKDLRKKGISVKFDARTSYKPGWKFAEYELKGVPLRIAIGPRDLESGTVEIARRDTLEKEIISRNDVVEFAEAKLKEIQENIFSKALDYRESHITKVDTFEEFKEVLNTKGGFVSAHWDGTNSTEENIKNSTKATIRCIPLNNKMEEGKCILTGNKSTQRVLFAKAY